MTTPVVGVLALQGDVREHVRVLEELGARVRLIRRPEDVASVDGLVLPGGESTVIGKLARTFGLAEPIRAAIGAGMPVCGTCAGLILLADRVVDAAPGQQTFGGLDATVRRNAFGSQQASFQTALSLPAVGAEPVAATFIRAPIVESVGPDVEILARLADGRIVAVRQGSLLATAFHPEVTGERRLHRLFLDRVARS